MEVKHNDSTINRPWGERPIDAPMVPIDLHAYTQQLMLEESWQKNDRNAITVFKTDQLTIVLMALHAGTETTPATVEGTGVMTLQMLDGDIAFSAGSDTVELSRGQMVVLHEHIPFRIKAKQESVCLLTMTRENNNNKDIPSPLH
ncbi:hypothetical protein [Polluticoccus soli]|uniref:hypothetical protein n=1 Tax=Polluticoccus soli TaxID=3034150 RepID=UPI0023E105CE|nr:hypothetical protein [Flavipsychrobacter sp. JY13-12]